MDREKLKPIKNQRALLIIDMQKGSFTSETPRYDTSGVIDRINKLSNLFRTTNAHVIHIQHDGTKFNDFIPYTTEWEILDDLDKTNTDHYIDKYANDCFYQSKLQTKLIDLDIKEIFITGCATDFCVEATIQSALTKDYNITIVQDGHTTGDRPHLTAKKVIEHYNWVWQNMIPTNGSIKVMSFNRILKYLTE